MCLLLAHSQPVPKRPIEAVLSGYLNTHLPLPCCSFHSVHTIRTKRQKPSQHQTEVPLFLNIHSRVFGNSELTVANASPTQSFASSVSMDDATEMPPVTATPDGSGRATLITAATPDGSGRATLTTSVGENQSQATPDFSSISGELAESTGDTGSDSTGKLSVTGISQRTTMAPPGIVTGASLRLRGNVVRNVNAGVTGDGTQRHRSSRTAWQTFGDQKNRAFTAKLKWLISIFMTHVVKLVSLVIYIVRRGLEPITQQSTLTIAKEQEKRVPLTNTLFSLGTEASSKHCSELWACGEDTQLSLLVLVGGASERYLWKELKDVVHTEENWSRALFNLKHTLFPDGQVRKSSKGKPSEEERRKLKRDAADAIKKFLPSKEHCAVWM